MKVVIELDEMDKNKKNIGLQKFFKASKDLQKKFHAIKMDDEGVIHVRAIAISKALTIQGDGDFDVGDPILETSVQDEISMEVETVDTFEHNGFVSVDKIVED